MEKYLEIYAHSPLFSGIKNEEILSILSCLKGQIVSYDKGTYLLRAGEPIYWVGMVLQGSAHILKEDFWGNRNILATARPGDLFAEAFACSQTALPEISVLAVEDTIILRLDFFCLLNTCSSACSFHTRLIRNLLKILADRNLQLTQKLEHLSKRTSREKILSYLSACSRAEGTASFSIPFNRQELADYLYLDRSTLSNELCKLRDEGILTFRKNRFSLSPALYNSKNI